MRILILGGTRFLGRRVAEALAEAGHELTLLSRRPGLALVGARQICAERTAGLATLRLSHFDLVLDFICYDDSSLNQLAASIVMDRYVLISTTWVPRLWSGCRADELVRGAQLLAAQLPDVTLNYLSGKLRAEQALTKLRQLDCTAVSLRLPIMLGDGDHTGRFNFYRRRLTDGGPLILVEGGQNYAQIAVMEDLARVIVRWSTCADIGRFPVWEALPGAGRSVRSIIETMVFANGLTPRLVDVPMAELALNLPAYLEREPFWRETALPLTDANIYAAVGMTPAVFGQILTKPEPSTDIDDGLRLHEINFIANRHID
jgi:nucleoside-diphosphate-sugar epimerase